MRRARLVILAVWAGIIAATWASGVRAQIVPGSGGGTFAGGDVANATGFPAGTAAAPSIYWTDDSDGSGTGFYRSAANTVAVSTNGLLRAWIDSTAVWSNTGTGSTGSFRMGSASFNLDQTYNGSAGTYVHNATAGNLQYSWQDGGAAYWQVRPESGAKALTESVATSFVQIAVPSGTSTGGFITYSIRAADATNAAVRAGVLPFAVINEAGTETCTIGTVGAATEVVAATTDTLTNTFTCATGLVNVVDLQANAASSLTQTSLTITYQIWKNGGTGAVTHQ